MILLPAIDLYDGKVVRLTKGDYAQMTVYRDDPAAQGGGLPGRRGQVAPHRGPGGGQGRHHPQLWRDRRHLQKNQPEGGDRRGHPQPGYHPEVSGTPGCPGVILGTAAVTDPKFLERALDRFGSQAAVGGWT